MRKIRQALILAGGDSTRFWPFSGKSLFPFLGKPLILHLIESIKAFVSHVEVVTSESNADILSKHFSSNVGLTIQRKDLPGMGGAILSSKDKITGETLVMNAEDVLDLGILHQLVDELNRSKADLIFLAKKVKEYFPGGYVKFDHDKVVEIVEKPRPEDIPSSMVKLVMDYHSDIQTFIKILEMTGIEKDNQYETAINSCIASQKTAAAIPYDGYWQPLKFAWHILPMMKHFLSTIHAQTIAKNVIISKHTLLEGPIRIEEGVRIGEFVKITGPCFIDKGAVIGDYAMVRESHIGKKTVVGGYSEVTRSYLHDGATLHRNYVGDSVLGKGVTMGGEATTANFRFDSKTIRDTNLTKLGVLAGDFSKIGVNATTLPGVKIGIHTFIGPAEVITEDIEDNMFVFGGKKTQNKLKESF